MRRATIEEQERSRARLKTAGVHVLVIDAETGSLEEIVSRAEAGRYVQLVSEGGFGLGLIDQTIVAVAPDSPLRPHFGVSAGLLTALRRRAAS